MASTVRNLGALKELLDGDVVIHYVNCRRFAHHATRRVEVGACDALRDEGFTPRNRIRARAAGSVLPQQRDDHKIAAAFELPDRRQAAT